MMHSIDQAYAQAQHQLNSLIDALVEDMLARPDQADEVPWANTVRYQLVTHAQHGFRLYPELLHVWEAAMYRLARQKADQIRRERQEAQP